MEKQKAAEVLDRELKKPCPPSAAVAEEVRAWRNIVFLPPVVAVRTWEFAEVRDGKAERS